MSIVASVVLTVLLNLAIRRWPGAAQRGEQQMTDWAERQRGAEFGPQERRVRVVVPWKAMIVASVGLTILLNVVIRLV
jgi:hypothetical protein